MTVGIKAIKRKHKTVLQVAFSYRGVQCRELLELTDSKANIAAAARLRGEILSKIDRNEFKYEEFFPESPRCKIFGRARGPDATELLKVKLAGYVGRVEKTLARSTYLNYKQDVENILIPVFGDYRICDLVPSVIRDWIAGQNVTLKRMSNLMLPLRAVLDEALADSLIPFNPLGKLKFSRILPTETIKSRYAPNPYTEQDLHQVLSRLTGVLRNVFQFWAYSGLRTSELIALSWEQVDLEAGTVTIDRAFVANKLKKTKTRAGMRTIRLLPAARQALEAQRAHTQLSGAHVFLNPRVDTPWAGVSTRSTWASACKLAKVLYRNPYQLRHTFASQLLSQGENPALISRMLGHKTTEMVFRNYGHWVNQGADLGFDRAPTRYGMHPLALTDADITVRHTMSGRPKSHVFHMDDLASRRKSA